jgi:hypothetical protein
MSVCLLMFKCGGAMLEREGLEDNLELGVSHFRDKSRASNKPFQIVLGSAPNRGLRVPEHSTTV